MLGKAERLIRSGKKIEAESLLRKSLTLLSMPHIVRDNPAEASLILTCTMLLEDLAAGRGVVGASSQDIVDILHLLQQFDSHNSPIENHEQWLAYFQQRVEESRQ